MRVVGVNPGPVATDRMLKIMKRKAIDMLGDESRWEELFDKYPGKRPATSEEVADLVAFLASPRAGYITGTNVTIDGRHLGPRLGHLSASAFLRPARTGRVPSRLAPRTAHVIRQPAQIAISMRSPARPASCGWDRTPTTFRPIRR